MAATAPPIDSLLELLKPEVLANPYPLYRRLRENAPVYWDPFLSAWVVTRYADVITVLHKYSADRTPTPEQLTAMGLQELAPIARLMVKQMLFMDATAHTRLRSLAAFAFTPARIAVLRSHIQSITDSLIDAIADREQADILADFARPMPAMITARMLGVPIEDHEKLTLWSADFAEMLGNFQHNPGRVQRVDPILHAGRSRWRTVYGRGDRGQLHRDYGRRAGNHDELDRQRSTHPHSESG
jgi:pimeloyl-[acyl-carrier protein] synthase